MKKFKNPIYVTKPILPNITSFYKKLKIIWKTGIFSNQGPFHQKLEKKLEKKLKVKNVSLFNNGTNALLAAIKALDLRGEVITTPYTFAATPHTLSFLGITPIFCDINPNNYVIDADKIEALITSKTTAILAVHVFGIPCDVKKIQAIANKYKLKVIYDAAHAFETEIDGNGIGTFGDITMFSFHPTKLFHTSEGGCLTYNIGDLKDKIDLLKNFGIKNENEVTLVGVNGKMDEIKAALGLECLKVLPKERQKRQRILNTYKKELKNIKGVTVYNLPKGIKNSFQYFFIKIDKNKFGKSRDDVYTAFKAYNVFTRKYFYPLCSSYACYKKNYGLPVADKVSNEILCLPFYGSLAIKDIKKICEILRELQKV